MEESVFYDWKSGHAFGAKGFSADSDREHPTVFVTTKKGSQEESRINLNR
jgi:hypothetical protein